MEINGENELYIKFADGRLNILSDSSISNYSLYMDGLTVPVPTVAMDNNYVAGNAQSDSIVLTVPIPSISVATEYTAP